MVVVCAQCHSTTLRWASLWLLKLGLMEPMQLNGGRFYLRPLSADDRINDVPALRLAADWADHSSDKSAQSSSSNSAIDESFIELRRNQWLTGTALSWAVCEQTQVEMLAEAILFSDDGVIVNPAEDNEASSNDAQSDDAHSAPKATHATLSIRPAGDPTRVVPNEPDAEKKTVGDAVEEAEGTIKRWAEGYLGLTVTLI